MIRTTINLPWRVTKRDDDPNKEWPNSYPFAIECAPPGVSAVLPIADVCDQPAAEQHANILGAAVHMLNALDLVVGSLLFDREDPVNVEVLRRVNEARALARGS